MSPRDLVKQLRDGLTLGQIAQQKGVDPNKVKAAMLSVLTARIDAAVKNGKLTQDRAAELKARLEKQVDLNQVITHILSDSRTCSGHCFNKLRTPHSCG